MGGLSPSIAVMDVGEAVTAGSFFTIWSAMVSELELRSASSLPLLHVSQVSSNRATGFTMAIGAEIAKWTGSWWEIWRVKSERVGVNLDEMNLDDCVGVNIDDCVGRIRPCPSVRAPPEPCPPEIFPCESR